MSKIQLEKAVEIAGGPGNLSASIRRLVPGSKVSRAHVYKWIHKVAGEVPPAEYVIPICISINWKMTPNMLRPDIYPNENDAVPIDNSTVNAKNSPVFGGDHA